MSRTPPKELAEKLASGLLAFPVTHFTESLEFDETPHRDHIAWLLQFEPAGLFVAGGAGEFFSLTQGGKFRLSPAAATEPQWHSNLLARLRRQVPMVCF